MTWKKVTHSIGGITPLGLFTISPGTPQNILANTLLDSVRYAFQCRQIGISVDSGSGVAYLNYGDTPGLGDQTVLIVGAGQQQSIPIGSHLKESMLDATQYYLDGSAALSVVVFAADATS
jgi:hypothetical protein